MIEEKDPIERMIEDIHSIKQALQQLTARSAPATAKDVQQLVNQIKQHPISHTIDADAVARTLLPKITEGLPTKVDLTAQVEAIQQAGKKAAEEVRQAGAGIPRHIYFSGEVFGFSNWKAFFLYMGTFLAVVGGLVYWNMEQQKQLRSKEIYEEFSNWVVTYYPAVHKAWNKKH